MKFIVTGERWGKYAMKKAAQKNCMRIPIRPRTAEEGLPHTYPSFLMTSEGKKRVRASKCSQEAREMVDQEYFRMDSRAQVAMAMLISAVTNNYLPKIFSIQASLQLGWHITSTSKETL